MNWNHATIGVIEQVCEFRPTYARPSLPLSDLLSTVEAPSETLDNLLQPRNELIAGKRILVFREMDGVSKEVRLVCE